MSAYIAPQQTGGSVGESRSIARPLGLPAAVARKSGRSSTRVADDTARAGRWFGWTLAVVALAALAVRVGYVLVDRRDVSPGGDAYFYHVGANLLADGKGFIEPFVY